MLVIHRLDITVNGFIGLADCSPLAMIITHRYVGDWVPVSRHQYNSVPEADYSTASGVLDAQGMLPVF